MKSFWGDYTSFDTFIKGHVLIPDGKGGWIHKYGQYHKLVVWPKVIREFIIVYILREKIL